MKREGRRRRPKDVDWGVGFLMILVWLCNAGIITCAVFAFLNWGAVDWIVGSLDWSIVVMSFTAVALVYALLAGSCILGFRQHIERSYITLRSSSFCRITNLVVAPVLVLTLLASLATLALFETDVSTKYIRQHSDTVFEGAKGSDERVHFDEFLNYMLSLPQFYGRNSSEFVHRFQVVFDAMDREDRQWLSREDMYRGTFESIWPKRRDLGISLTFAGAIFLTFFIVYVFWYLRLRSERFEEKLRLLRTQAALHREPIAEERLGRRARASDDGFDDPDDDAAAGDGDDTQGIEVPSIGSR